MKRVSQKLKMIIYVFVVTVTIIGCGGSSQTSDDQIIGQALLGSLSEADFEIYRQDNATPLYSGTTAKGDGNDTNTAGWMEVSSPFLQTLSSENIYIIKVSGGLNVDVEDDGVWDALPLGNTTDLHVILSAEEMKVGGVIVNILTETIYQNMNEELETNILTVDEVQERMDSLAVELLKADGTGDINHDSRVDYADIIRWDPRENKDTVSFIDDLEEVPIHEWALEIERVSLLSGFSVSPPAVQGVRTLGGSGSDLFRGVAMDDSGNGYAVGYTSSNDGDITDGHEGEKDALIVKFDAEGHKLWDKTIGGSQLDAFNDIVIDQSGNVYAVGYTHTEEALSHYKVALIVKFDRNGNRLWKKTFGEKVYGSESQFDGVAIDSASNVYAVGQTPEESSEDKSDSISFIVKLDSSGETVWEKKSLGGIHTGYFWDIAIDNNGDFYISGGNARIMNGTGGYDLAGILMKVDSNAQLHWSTQSTNAWGEEFTDIAIDSYGYCYVVGYQFGTDTLMTKFTPDGTKVWEQKIGGSEPDIFWGIKIDKRNKLYVVGSTRSDDGNITDRNNGGYDALIMKFDVHGNKLWDRTIGGSEWDTFYDMAMDTHDNLYAVGYTESDDGDITDGNHGDKDALIVKF